MFSMLGSEASTQVHSAQLKILSNSSIKFSYDLLLFQKTRPRKWLGTLMHSSSLLLDCSGSNSFAEQSSWASKDFSTFSTIASKNSKGYRSLSLQGLPIPSNLLILILDLQAPLGQL